MVRPVRLLAAVLGLLAAVPLARAEAPFPQRYAFLAGSAWYVPRQTLPAVMLDPQAGTAAAIVDQTVWSIEGYRGGYFTGRAAVLLKRDGRPVAPIQCLRLVGSVTPEGSVLVSFVPADATTADGATTGVGRLERDGTRWRFLMQMATGSSSLVAHWSYMDACRAGESCRTRLPGTVRGLDAFLARCKG